MNWIELGKQARAAELETERQCLEAQALAKRQDEQAKEEEALGELLTCMSEIMGKDTVDAIVSEGQVHGASIRHGDYIFLWRARHLQNPNGPAAQRKFLPRFAIARPLPVELKDWLRGVKIVSCGDIGSLEVLGREIDGLDKRYVEAGESALKYKRESEERAAQEALWEVTQAQVKREEAHAPELSAEQREALVVLEQISNAIERGADLTPEQALVVALARYTERKDVVDEF